MIIGNSQIDQTTESSAADCCNTCNKNLDCVAYTFDTSSHQCFLKDNTGGNRTETNRISGTNGRPSAWFACTGRLASTLKYCDTSLSFEERARSLASLIPLNITGQQLTARQSPSVGNIELPSYYWGTNAIHGVQNVGCLSNGQCPTSFPAPCALSATFNYTLVHGMGNVIGRELRAYFNGQVHNSLDTWSPTLNLARDPRWGRNVESPGEDPYTNGRFGIAYTEGLQQLNVDPTVVQAVVTLKHWIAYSLESYDGHTRHNYNAVVEPWDLTDSFFPPYEATITEADALGIMCSYNELNGKPTCGNPALTTILRDQWNFTGYMTSDTDSIHDIVASHHYESSYPEAVRDGLEAGCDINSGNTYSDNLETAVTSGLVNQSYAMESLYRTYLMRFRMGLFDPHVPNPYRGINTTIVGCDDHQDLSKLAARKAMVLLKNTDNVLPFPKGKSLAVIGASSNTTEDLLGNYNGPICPNGKYDCYPTVYQQFVAQNAGGSVSLVDDPSKVDDAVAAAKAADFVVLTASNAMDGGREGQDRYNISLAPDQLALCQAVLAVGKPTVLVLINGGIIAIDDMKETAPSILEAFMPGVHGAAAIAETVFGDNIPGGKMPVTMYHSDYVNEVDFLNMSMVAGPGRTYRYYTGEPLFPFGFGLSYTTFSLKWNPQPPEVVTLGADDATTYSVVVTNTGSVTGDEVVFAYWKPTSVKGTLPADTPLPIKAVFDWTRITLAPGESQTLQFTAPAAKFALVDNDGHRALHGGVYDIIFSRGHGRELLATIEVEVDEPVRQFTFPEKWW